MISKQWVKYSFISTIGLLFLIGATVQADSAQSRCDIYPKGEDHTDVSIPCVFNQRQGYITINRSDNVYHDLSPQADAIGHFKDQNGNDVYRQSGLGEDGVIFRFKNESIYLYWDAVGLLENTRHHSTSVSSQAFDKKFSLQGITFQVSSANEGSLNTLTIKPSGLELNNSVITREIDGTVTGAEIADINSDGSPEIYVYINSVGSGAYGDVIAYSANNKKSLSDIYLAPLSDDKVNSKGYMGHDEFAIIENSLARRFPIYKKGDSNSQPTGGTRQLQYKLVAGEASWQLKLVNSTEF